MRPWEREAYRRSAADEIRERQDDARALAYDLRPRAGRYAILAVALLVVSLQGALPGPLRVATFIGCILAGFGAMMLWERAGLARVEASWTPEEFED